MSETRLVNIKPGYWMGPTEPTEIHDDAVWVQTFPFEPSKIWLRKDREWFELKTLETKFDKCDNYNAMLKEINERGERIKKLGEEVEKAFREGFDAGCDYEYSTTFRLQEWESSRAKRVSEGLE